MSKYDGPEPDGGINYGTLHLIRTGDLRVRDVVRGFFTRWHCRLFGHKWERQETYYPGAGTHYEGELCARCWTWQR